MTAISQKAICGTWTLTSYVSTAADGAAIENFGAAPKGIAMFDAHDNFSIVIVRPDLPRFASGNRERGTAEENGAVVRGSIAYFGRYSLSETGGGVIFEVLGATLPNWIGTTQKRGAAMASADELVLTNASASGGGSARISWIRAR